MQLMPGYVYNNHRGRPCSPGRAALCPTVDMPSVDVKDMKPGSYQMVRFCMEPTSFEVRGLPCPAWLVVAAKPRVTASRAALAECLACMLASFLHAGCMAWPYLWQKRSLGPY